MELPEPRLQVVPMSLETVETVAALEEECFTSPWSLDSLAEELSNPLAVTYTALLDGDVVGYVGMHHIIDEGYITNIAVTENCRRHGIATELMNRLLHYAEENDLAMVTLEVRASNAAAIALYGGLGFEEAGRRKDYYTRPTEDALIMTRKM